MRSIPKELKKVIAKTCFCYSNMYKGGSMNKRLLLCVFIIVSIIVGAIISYVICLNLSQKLTKIEVYENEFEYLTILYYNNNNISFRLKRKGTDHDFLSSGATFLNENTAVLDGNYMFPESPGIYYEFVFKDGYVEFFNSGKMISNYNLIIENTNLN